MNPCPRLEKEVAMTARMLRTLLIVALVGSTPSVLWAQTPPQPPLVNPAAGQPIDGGQVILVVPRSHDVVLGYSKITGRWAKQPVKLASQTPLVPVVADEVGAFQVGKEVFAFSAEHGRWKSVAVPDLKTPLAVDAKCVTIQTTDTFYVFSAKAGQWSSVSLKDGTIDNKER
jgi:hypothetical protein